MCADEPMNWSCMLSLAEYWFNTNYYTAACATPFEVLYGYPPPMHIPYFPKDNRVPAVDRTLIERELMLSLLRFHLRRAQERMQTQANKHRTERQLQVGDLVYVKLKMYRQKSIGEYAMHKLNYLYYGPYRVLDRIGEVAYKLELPPGSKVHPTFHVSQLKKKIGPSLQGGSQLHSQLLFTPSVGDMPERMLQRELIKRGNRADVRMLVSWKGRDPEETSWLYWGDLKKRFPDISLSATGEFIMPTQELPSSSSLRQG